MTFVSNAFWSWDCLQLSYFVVNSFLIFMTCMSWLSCWYMMGYVGLIALWSDKLIVIGLCTFDSALSKISTLKYVICFKKACNTYFVVLSRIQYLMFCSQVVLPNDLSQLWLELCCKLQYVTMSFNRCILSLKWIYLAS